MSLFKKIIRKIQQDGIFAVIKKCIDRLYIPKIKRYKECQKLFRGKNGLEIGGPSSFFKKHNNLPVYQVVNNLDGVNFSTSTIWEGNISCGLNYDYGGKTKGYQYICDAVNLNMIPSHQYDFILSCNNLEHIANPLEAVKEWLRVLKPDGILLLVLPRKDHSFDRNRQITKFDHLLQDYLKHTDEGDLTHVDEVLELHDLSKDGGVTTFKGFKQRCINNEKNRCLHHHVFDLELLYRIYRFHKIKVIYSDTTKYCHVIAGVKK